MDRGRPIHTPATPGESLAPTTRASRIHGQFFTRSPRSVTSADTDTCGHGSCQTRKKRRRPRRSVYAVYRSMSHSVSVPGSQGSTGSSESRKARYPSAAPFRESPTLPSMLERSTVLHCRQRPWRYMKARTNAFPVGRPTGSGASRLRKWITVVLPAESRRYMKGGPAGQNGPRTAHPHSRDSRRVVGTDHSRLPHPRPVLHQESARSVTSAVTDTCGHGSCQTRKNRRRPCRSVYAVYRAADSVAFEVPASQADSFLGFMEIGTALRDHAPPAARGAR